MEYRGFCHTTKQCFFTQDTLPKDVIDEIMVGMYDDGGGCVFEFGIRWHKLAMDTTPRIEIFEDGWEALIEFDDLFRELYEESDKEAPHRLLPEEVIAVLKACDFVDRTKYSEPAQTDYPPSITPEELYDGYSVYQSLTDKQKKRTSPENVSDVLDSVVRLMKESNHQ